MESGIGISTIIIIILTALSSGFLSAFITKWMDIAHENKVRKLEEERAGREKKEALRDDYYRAKKEVYFEALKRLAEIRHGFNVMQEDLWHDEEQREYLKKLNDNAFEFSAKLRMYSTDDIYDLYWELSKSSCYAFAPSNGAWHLMENGKEMYSIYTTLLARLMQADLGYRDYMEYPEMIKCPKCGTKRDIYKTCPKCRMTWKETFNEMQKPIREEWIKQQEELKKAGAGDSHA